MRILGAFIATRKYYVNCSVVGGSVLNKLFTVLRLDVR